MAQNQRHNFIEETFRRYREEHEDKTPYNSWNYDSSGEKILDAELYKTIEIYISEIREKVVKFRKELKAILKENKLSIIEPVKIQLCHETTPEEYMLYNASLEINFFFTWTFSNYMTLTGYIRVYSEWLQEDGIKTSVSCFSTNVTGLEKEKGISRLFNKINKEDCLINFKYFKAIKSNKKVDGSTIHYDNLLDFLKKEGIPLW